MLAGIILVTVACIFLLLIEGISDVCDKNKPLRLTTGLSGAVLVLLLCTSMSLHIDLKSSEARLHKAQVELSESNEAKLALGAQVSELNSKNYELSAQNLGLTKALKGKQKELKESKLEINLTKAELAKEKRLNAASKQEMDALRDANNNLKDNLREIKEALQ